MSFQANKGTRYSICVTHSKESTKKGNNCSREVEQVTKEKKLITNSRSTIHEVMEDIQKLIQQEKGVKQQVKEIHEDQKFFNKVIESIQTIQFSKEEFQVVMEHNRKETGSILNLKNK